MNKKIFIGIIAAVLMTVGLAPAALAQDGEAETESATDSTESADDESAEDERGQKTPEGGTDAAADSADGADAEPGESAGEEEAASADAEAAEEGSAEAQDAEEDSGPKTGPGGRPLRDDYPGTEESKQERMATEKIEGLEFDGGETPEDAYDMRIRELETRVDDLKEKVFQSKSRIVLLKETVLSGNISGSRAIISHNTDLGGAYQVMRVLYSLDGARVFNQSDNEGSLADKKNFEIYNGSISPGNHKLSILIELKGSGFGVFSYMEGYKFRIKDSCQFKAQSGKNTIVEVKLYDRGRAKYDYEERPAVRCSVSSIDYAADNVGSAPTQTDEGAAAEEEGAGGQTDSQSE